MKYRALYEARWILAILFAAWVVALFTLQLLCIPLAILLIFTVCFFRDPDRQPPEDPSLAVSAADGVVVLVDEVEESEFLNARLKRIAIFLSIFDVHINRSPIAGKIIHSEPKPGKFLDARDPNSSIFNVSRTWVFQGTSTTVLVRQITGAIARRIVPWSRVGDMVERGERFGLIRFGSRTEILLPINAEILVKVGDRVRGAATPVARLQS